MLEVVFKSLFGKIENSCCALKIVFALLPSFPAFSLSIEIPLLYNYF